MLHNKNGFTLAEILITLGIIGVIAAMTIPALFQQYQKIVVESKLRKFYSSVNHAVKLAEIDYGDKANWWAHGGDGANTSDPAPTTDMNGNPVEGKNNYEKWWNKYLSPYMRNLGMESLDDGSFIVYFPDGSALQQTYVTRVWTYFPGSPKKCGTDRNGFWQSGVNTGKCKFAFEFAPYRQNQDTNGFEPFSYPSRELLSDKTREDLQKSCRSGTAGMYCTALIKRDGWKIAKDYPFKVHQ